MISDLKLSNETLNVIKRIINVGLSDCEIVHTINYQCGVNILITHSDIQDIFSLGQCSENFSRFPKELKKMERELKKK